MQKTITNQIYIERTPEQVMDFLLRPENWLKFASGLVDAEPRNKGFAIVVILKHHRRSNTNILRMKIIIYAFHFLLLGSCNQSPEKSLTQISEQTKQEAIATLKNFAKVRTAIPPTPKTYLNLFANDERFIMASDYGFETGYQQYYDRRNNDTDYAQGLNPDWITRFDLDIHDIKVSRLNDNILLYTAFYDEFVVAKSGDTLNSKNNIMHGTLIRIKGEWKILSMMNAHPGENEKSDAEFDERNQKK